MKMFNLLDMLRKNFLWFLQFIALCTVVGWIASLAISSILGAVYPVAPPWVHDARCAVGFPSQNDKKCLQGLIRKIIQDHETDKNERDKKHALLIETQKKIHKEAIVKVDQERQKLADRFHKLASIEDRFDTVNLFAERQSPDGRVSTGAMYSNIATKPTYIKSWCNFYPRPGNILEIASHIAGENIEKNVGFFKNYARLGTTRSKAKAALKSCVWPEGVK